MSLGRTLKHNFLRLCTRAAQESDAAFLYEVYASTRADELAQSGWHETQVQTFLRSQFDLQHAGYHAQYPHARFEVVEADDTPVGRFYVHESASEIRLIDIALLPAWRGRQIGSALIAALIMDSERRQCPIGLHVGPHNRAMALYRRLGFTVIESGAVYTSMLRQP